MISCEVVKDLLPPYVSGLASEDTRALVDEHIGQCADCQAKLSELQNRLAEQLREKDANGINVFKVMKKKIFKRNVIVGVTVAAVVAVLALFVGVQVVVDKPIAYYDGLVHAEVRYIDYITGPSNTPDYPKTSGKLPVLDLTCTRNYDLAKSRGRTIMRDGERVSVQYICYLTNSLTQSDAQNGGGQNIFRPTEEDIIGKEAFSDSMGWNTDDPIKTEVYYLTDMEAVCNGVLSDAEYDAYRLQGDLIWSGVLE